MSIFIGLLILFGSALLRPVFVLGIVRIEEYLWNRKMKLRALELARQFMAEETLKNLQPLIKALEAGGYSPTATDRPQGLQVESLEATLRLVTFDLAEFVWPRTLNEIERPAPMSLFNGRKLMDETLACLQPVLNLEVDGDWNEKEFEFAVSVEKHRLHSVLCSGCQLFADHDEKREGKLIRDSINDEDRYPMFADDSIVSFLRCQSRLAKSGVIPTPADAYWREKGRADRCGAV